MERYYRLDWVGVQIEKCWSDNSKVKETSRIKGQGQKVLMFNGQGRKALMIKGQGNLED